MNGIRVCRLFNLTTIQAILFSNDANSTKLSIWLYVLPTISKSMHLVSPLNFQVCRLLKVFWHYMHVYTQVHIRKYLCI